MQLLQVSQLLAARRVSDSVTVGVNETTLDYLNQTTLSYFNYTTYNNGTLSNGSSCFLIFDQYVPTVFPNGTVVNGTSCYFPYYPVDKRGSLGLAFAVLFALSIMFTLVNLSKHGRLYLPQEKRFRAIGRRWQWYWMLFVAVCGIISGVSAVDVDRDYLQNLAIILQNFFFYLMMPGILACVWEGVRHWGSWQERQIYDHDPFSLPSDDRRGTKEFYMPLVFYLFAWLMTNLIAKPAATDSRFKAGGFLALVAWCIICYSLQHSIHYYKPRNRGPFWSFIGFVRSAPTRFLLTIPLLGVVVGYAIASSFMWTINIGNENVNSAWLYGLGYAPVILIIIINEIAGFIVPNEDRALIQQRVDRGQAIDAELGIRTKKPAWWKASSGHGLTTEQRLKALTTEIGGGRATTHNIGRTMELGNMPARPRDEENPFRDPDEITLLEDKGPERRPGLGNPDREAESGRGISSATTATMASRTSQIPPQRVR
ncbi:MAG: hypothetical protein Q9187_007049, partial [Circinaria calcarea]